MDIYFRISVHNIEHGHWKSSNVKNIFKVQGRLPDSKKGELSIRATSCSLKIRENGELVLKENKYPISQSNYPIDPNLVFEGILLNCIPPLIFIIIIFIHF